MLEADPTAGPIVRTPARAVDGVARALALPLALAAAYLVVLGRLGLAGPFQWTLAAVVVASRVARPRVRGALLDALPFALFAAVYDLLRLARRFVVAQGVEVWRPYWFDQVVFGVGTHPERLTLNELFARHHWAVV